MTINVLRIISRTFLDDVQVKMREVQIKDANLSVKVGIQLFFKGSYYHMG